MTRVILTTLFAIAIAFFVMGEMGKLSWFFDLWSNFQIQYLIAFGLFFLFFIFARNYYRSGVAIVLFIICFIRIMPYIGDSPKVVDTIKPEGATRIMFYNMYVGNTHYEEIAKMVEHVNPDVVIFEEVEGVAYNKLKDELSDTYEFSGFRKGPLDYFDIAYFSKTEPYGMGVHYLSDEKIPTIDLFFIGEKGPYHVFGVHTRAPTNGPRAIVRNEHLAALAELTRKTGGTVIAGGDFNITPWSPYWRKFAKYNGLLEARRGMALAASWPEWLPGKLRIPIDHILVSPGVNVLGVGVGEATGSDHLPIVADISL